MSTNQRIAELDIEQTLLDRSLTRAEAQAACDTAIAQAFPPERKAPPVWAVTPPTVGQDYDEAFEGHRH